MGLVFDAGGVADRRAYSVRERVQALRAVNGRPAMSLLVYGCLWPVGVAHVRILGHDV